MEDKHIYFNWIADQNIPHFMKTQRQLVLQYPLALITCLDSSRASHLVAAVRNGGFMPDGTDFSFADNLGIWIASVNLPSLSSPSQKVFVGFDEVWLFIEQPNVISGPVPSITSEAPVTDEEYVSWREEIATWMLNVDCRVGLGDGHGLNLAVLDDQADLKLKQ